MSRVIKKQKKFITLLLLNADIKILILKKREKN